MMFTAIFFLLILQIFMALLSHFVTYCMVECLYRLYLQVTLCLYKLLNKGNIISAETASGIALVFNLIHFSGKCSDHAWGLDLGEFELNRVSKLVRDWRKSIIFSLSLF